MDINIISFNFDVNITDVNECEEFGSSICKGGQCENTDGAFICRCPQGFRINTAGTECIDTRNEDCYEMYSKGV